MPYLTLWSDGGPFLCVEPCWGLTDHDEQRPFENKEGIHVIAAGGELQKSFTMTPRSRSVKTQTLSMSASLRALLAGSIDYAGLFPPASLALEPALRNQPAYLRDEDVWMLGTFVLPIAKFEDASALLSTFHAEPSPAHFRARRENRKRLAVHDRAQGSGGGDSANSTRATARSPPSRRSKWRCRRNRASISRKPTPCSPICNLPTFWEAAAG